MSRARFVCLGGLFLFFVATAGILAQNQGGGNNNGGGNLGGNAATTVQLPTFGVSIDADGTLEAKLFTEPNRKLLTERLAAARASKPGELWSESKLRKVSLVGLEREWQNVIAKGDAPDDALRNLAGLTRIQYIFCYPATNEEPGDIVLAGPAEPWANDPAGRPVGIKSGRPTLLLTDLAVALRAYPPGSQKRPFIGCTIDPPAEGLAKFMEFQKTIPKTIRDDQRESAANAMAKGIAQALGLAQIRVFEVSPRTHFAQVLVEADYRMKRMAIGAENPPVRMTTFAGALQSPQQGNLQRWWFTPDYQCLRVSQDRLAAEMVGQGVQLQAEDKLIGADGTLVPAGAKPNPASDLFVTSFTKKYPEIAAASPVYAQMRAVIDLVVTAALIRRFDYYKLSRWDATVLRDEKQVITEEFAAPMRVPCLVNAFWKGSRLFAPAGGGVSIRPDEALEPTNLLKDDKEQVATAYRELRGQRPNQRWWWD